MLRAYKYRIYPTDEQKVLFAKTFGCCRFVYNWALNMKITDGEPVYYTFETLVDLAYFHKNAVKYIQDTLAEGWKEKDAIDTSVYY